MEIEDSFTFFPGKGIYTNPNSGLDPVIEEYSKEKAENIFSAFSCMVTDVEDSLIHYPENIIKKAKKLFELHGKVVLKSFEAIKIKSPHLDFGGMSVSKGTRVSFKAREIFWDKIEEKLLIQGYRLKKRHYLKDNLDDLVKVYVLVHGEFGVISEGKGFTEEQARNSALAEGVERLYSRPDDKKRFVIDSQDNLFKNKKTKLEIISGPRDTFSPRVRTEWVDAVNILNNEEVYLPAEISYFKYIPTSVRLKLFSLDHTTGLAVGSSIEDAALSGIFEIMERDSYWITMRCKLNHPDIDLTQIDGLCPKVLKTIDTLRRQGLEVFIKDMSLDWGVPIAHAVLMDTENKIPAFAHGSGAAFDWATAISRAVAELVQMYSGMIDFTNVPDNWERIISAGDVLGRGELAWSDPLFLPHIGHLVTKSEGKFNNNTPVISPQDLLDRLKNKGYSVIVTELNEVEGLSLVRVYIPEATQPDERLERISLRMEEFRIKNNLSGFYTDPILT